MNSQEEESNVTREDVLRLIKRRDNIDIEIQALGEILSSNHVGMNEPLVDQEGYPRNDIDVYQVRTARNRIICLQNDFKGLTKEIENKMEALAKINRENGSVSTPMTIDESPNETIQLTNPIVRVNEISEGSPAYKAGLRIGDDILSFGSINGENFQSLEGIGGLVARSVGKSVVVKVLRDRRVVQLALIPGPWSGRGLLGCNIVPIAPINVPQDVDR